ncbi:AAA family ATPase [Streptomyces sp. RKND-216]|uniref:helix-hairpin-helix domain-containing protein n=1 Tax=Streptomyces sp. RKND-216 TaxID=2562581 RepID=UPI001FF8AE78|nr:AAA family ATPase [Streptomyces sp. RKND-216]
MSSQDATGGGAADAPAGGNARAAELLAAVRAVESGERSADSFFTERLRPPARRAPRAPGGPGPVAAAGAGDGEPVPVTVPDAVRAVLARGGAPEALGEQVVAALGERADEVLTADPWQLLAVPSVRTEQADSFARALLGDACGPGDERRARALVVRMLERAAARGHTVLEPAALSRALTQHAVPEPDEAVRAALDDGAVLVFEETLDSLDVTDRAAADASEADAPEGEDGEEERPVRLLVGLERHALAEESLADALARLAGTVLAGDADAWEAVASAAPTPSAAELARATAGHGVVTHSGGEAARAEPAFLAASAGTLGLRAFAVAHGENGRERLARLLPDDGGDAAGTVAGLLAGREGPPRDTDGLWELDLLVVCDAAQLGTEEAAALAESLPDGARLVLSGDPHELGPAGPGQVFHDVTAARCCPQVISRTPDPGPLGELVSGVGAGELLQVQAPDREVVIVPVRDAGEAVHRTVQLVADSVPRAIGVPADETQVIVPGHDGAAGTRALNAALKERLNPGPGRFGGFDPGDRVLYSPAPGRGATGTVVAGDDDGLRIELPGCTVAVRPDRVAATVRHGWAVTAHQAAGARWPAVVAVLPGDASDALTREWVYTAFGRAARHLSVVHGAEHALAEAVAGRTAPPRTTRLRRLLAQAVAAVRGGTG